MNCPNCGAFLGKEDVFCGECGQPVSREGTPGAMVTPEEVKDLETDLLPAVPLSPEPPASRPAAAATRPAAPAARPATAGKRFPLVPVLIGASIALVGLCLCFAAAVVILSSAGTPTPTVDVSFEDIATDAVVEPAGGALIYDDTFDDDSAWDVYDDGDTWAAYSDGGYRLGVRAENYVTWSNPVTMPEFDNFELTVDTRLVEGPVDNNLGVLVRYQGDGDNFYWFQISNDGYYAVDVMQAGEWLGLVDWQASGAIATGMDAVNRIQVVCAGSQFTFYVNDTYLTAVTDDTYGVGSIGLAAGTFDEPGVVIEFDNLQVRALE